MKLACVVHRYGPQVTGGSEAHCRALATRLARHHEVDVLTSCATDYVTWRNVLPAGDSWDRGSWDDASHDSASHDGDSLGRHSPRGPSPSGTSQGSPSQGSTSPGGTSPGSSGPGGSFLSVNEG